VEYGTVDTSRIFDSAFFRIEHPNALHCSQEKKRRSKVRKAIYLYFQHPFCGGFPGDNLSLSIGIPVSLRNSVG